MPEPYRQLDTAVLEALVLKGPLGLTEDDIDHLHGLRYSRTDDEALRLVAGRRRSTWRSSCGRARWRRSRRSRQPG